MTRVAQGFYLSAAPSRSEKELYASRRRLIFRCPSKIGCSSTVRNLFFSKLTLRDSGYFFAMLAGE
jgi:hypothetical protein